MKNIAIISCDKVFARMLCLELSELGLDVKSVTDKLSVPVLKLALADTEYAVIDSKYFSDDLSVLQQFSIYFTVYSKNAVSDIPDNVTGVFIRPFKISDFTRHIVSHMQLSGNISRETHTENIITEINLDRHLKQATIDNVTVKLSPKEFSLLTLLYQKRGNTVLRKEVLDSVWGKDYDEKNNVDNVYINYLRKKIDEKVGRKIIYTVRGKGYMIK